MAIARAKQPQDKKPALPPRTETRRAVSVETRPQLFATLCALDAAGFDSSVSTTNQSPGRVKLRERMLALQGPAVDALRTYYQRDYESGVEYYSAPLSEVAFTVTNYLREIIKSNSPRTFSLYVEPLAGRKTNFRNYGDHYELVVSPTPDPPLEDIRHAFLHFLLDPMAIRYRTQAARAAPLLEYAAHAPLLPVEFHDDFSAFFDECLVRAVELRLRHLAPADLASEIDQAENSGYVLVRPIYAGLSGFEKSEPAMSYYLPELIKGIDVAGEARRLRGVKFAEEMPAGGLT